MKWTDEQQKAIALRDRDLLVSAAAGSGKTAVLVERIIGLVSDPVHPADIDRMLIVTFTKAAASEMRSRLYEKLSERAEESGDPHLLRQVKLVPRAEVCTIDSFCTNLLRNHFHEIALDPAFRVADENEAALLRSDVLGEVLEEEYAEGSETFIDFTENFSSGRSDEAIEDAILKLFRFSEAAPWPRRWLEDCRKAYRIESPEELEESTWFRWYLQEIRMKLSGTAASYQELVHFCEEREALSYLLPVYRADLRMLQDISASSGREELLQKLGKMKFGRKPPVPKGTDPGPAGEYQSSLRDSLKEEAQKIRKNALVLGEDAIRFIRLSAPSADELVRLTIKFSERFTETKRKKGLIDFSDAEHLALQVLRTEDGELTETAKELSAHYETVMIDEYQDSNYVQEALLTAVARYRDGHPVNMFMVGDMKQSIYRFRMARPDLFTGKYQSYTEEDSGRQRVTLDRNFRSSVSVIDTVNFFFRAMMRSEVGGIVYDRAAELKVTPPLEGQDGKEGHRSELLLLDTAEKDPEDPLTDREWEGLMIADRIRTLISEKLPVYDKETGGMRPLRYGDFAILLRSMSGYDTAFTEALESFGIPVSVESRSGYYDSWEITLALNLLNVIDNPLNDFALAAVLHSPLFSFTNTELSEIRLEDSEDAGIGYFGAVKRYILSHPEEEDGNGLSARLRAFLRQMESYRERAVSESLSGLLRYIYADTGLLSFVTAMQGGARRAANLARLIRKAESFEETSYRGIFHFIRYVEKMKQSEMDEGEVSPEGESADAVRIMTVHKSKGLEFPVVFVSGLSKKFNKSDLREKMALHPEFGIGLSCIDHVRRTRRDTLLLRALREKNETEFLGEELRILYVAMSRAREKLILTGAGDVGKIFELYGSFWKGSPMMLTVSELLSAENYLAWILRAYRDSAPVSLIPASREMILSGMQEVPEEKKAGREDPEHAAFLRSLGTLPGILSYDYHYDDLRYAFRTVSVSRLKAERIALSDPEENDTAVSLVQDIVPDEEEEPAESRKEAAEIPKEKARDAKEKAQLLRAAAARGTLYHRVMELLDFSGDPEEQLRSFRNEGLISAAEQDTIDIRKIRAFLKSGIGKRAAEALASGRGFREKPFIIGIPLRELYPKMRLRDESELIMVQGIIDLGFEDEGGLVLVDYKTDRVRKPETLVKRYRIQLDLYARALTQATGKPVTEKWIWSFALEKAICL